MPILLALRRHLNPPEVLRRIVSKGVELRRISAIKSASDGFLALQNAVRNSVIFQRRYLTSGVGSRIEAQLGGKLDPLFGEPVLVAADVVDLKEGMLQADVDRLDIV